MGKSPTAIDDIDLMQYFDGELSPEEEAEVRAHLADDADGLAKLESLDQVGETMATYYELAADDAEPRLARMWDRIERRIQTNGSAEEAPVPVVAPRPAAAQPTGLWASLRRWFGEHRGYIATSAVTAGAVAALILVLRPSTERIIERPGPERIVQIPAEPQPSPVVPVTSEPAAVEELSVNDGTGYILTIPGEEGEADTTVIWIEPEESKLEGPI